MLRETPAWEGVVMFTTGTPLRDSSTVGRCAPGVSRSGTIRPCRSPYTCCACSGATTPTQPRASHSAKLTGRSAATAGRAAAAAAACDFSHYLEHAQRAVEDDTEQVLIHGVVIPLLSLPRPARRAAGSIAPAEVETRRRVGT